MNPEEQKQETNTPQNNPLKALRTYKADVQDVLSSTNANSATILVAEEKRREKQLTMKVPAKPDYEKKAEKKFFIIIGIALLLLGTITIVAVLYLKSSTQETIVKNTKALIPFSQEKDIKFASTTRESLISELAFDKQSLNLPLNSVLYINTINPSLNQAPVEDVFSMLAPKAPSQIARAFGDKYMIGVYSFSTNEPFMIFTVDDYKSAYSGMLMWEKNIPSDIGRLFDIAENSTSTKAFVDDTFKNKDIRVAKNQDGKSKILYSFINRSTLIITTNEDILNALIDKYLSSTNTQ